MIKKESSDYLIQNFGLTQEEIQKIVEKSIAGGELTDESELNAWLTNRFFPNVVSINEIEYSKMCIDALKILGNTAATDYGGSRQRDLGQLWADMTRGYLGEMAFSIFLKKNWNISCELGHEIGQLEDYLPMDIHSIKKEGQEERKPNLNISIKTTKWNGIWLDIPGDQFRHSDIHVLIKIGVGRDHLFAFFKNLSVFKDKVLKKGVEVGSLTTEESEKLFNNLPSFRPVTAYICGFIRKDETYKNLSYNGKKGRKNYNLSAWNGPINPGDLDKIKIKEGILGTIKFEGIGNFAHDKGFLFNAGNLLWRKTDWDNVINLL